MAQIVRFCFHYSQEKHTHAHTHTHKEAQIFQAPKSLKKRSESYDSVVPRNQQLYRTFLPWWNLEVGGWGQALCSDRLRFFLKFFLREMEGLRNPLGTSFLHERENTEREREKSTYLMLTPPGVNRNWVMFWVTQSTAALGSLASSASKSLGAATMTSISSPAMDLITLKSESKILTLVRLLARNICAT